MGARDRAAPHHARISDTLRRQITDGALRPGELLPSEARLCETFGVSRSVVRQALATLERDALVVKSQGRGTVVAAGVAELHRNVRWVAGLSAQMRALGTRVQTRVLDHTIRAVPASLREVLGVRALYLERLRSVDRRPVALIRTWVPLAFAPHLPRAALQNRSLHEMLESRAGVCITGGQRQIRAVAAQEPIAGLLHAPAGLPLLLLEGDTVDADGRAVEIFATWHRSDRIAFDVKVDEAPGPPVRSAPAPAGSATLALQRLSRAEADARALADDLAALRAALQDASPVLAAGRSPSRRRTARDHDPSKS